MKPSTRKATPDRALVCARAGELPEFESLLTSLGVALEHTGGELPSADQLADALLVVVPGTRLTEGRAPSVHRWPRTIAIVDEGSRTLTAHLNRLGVAMIVRRPIHPRALRLLLLHVLYRGPERRIKKRVLIGHPIRAGVGLFKNDATLLELSRTGARISLTNPPKVGTTIQLVLGKELTNAKPIKIVAKVVRSVRTGSAGREDEIGLALQGAGDLERSIQAILDRFASGPASLGTAPRAPLEPRSPRPAPGAVVVARTGAAVPLTTSPRPAAPGAAQHPEPAPALPAARVLPPSYQPEVEAADVAVAIEAAPVDTFEDDGLEAELELEYDLEADLDGELELDEELETAEGSDADGALEGESAAERRHSQRVPYTQRIVALGQEAARVVVGRDLCFGGMRIAANAALAVGDVLRIALHAGTETEPLVVLAGVERDDGPDGLVLAFAQLTSGQRDRLEKILAASSPIQAPGPEADEGDALVVGELLARVARGRSEESA